MLVHMAFIEQFRISGVIFPSAYRVDPDQAALIRSSDLGLLCLQKTFISAMVCGKGLKSTEATSRIKSIQMSLFVGHIG